MFTITNSIEIDRPPLEVFAIAGDYNDDPQWRQGVVAMTVDEAGGQTAGALTRETMLMMGQKAVTVAEVVDFEAGSRTAFCSMEGPIACEGHRLFEPNGSGTRFTYSLTLKPTGWLRRIEFLLKPMFARQIRGDLVRLKALVESKPLADD